MKKIISLLLGCVLVMAPLAVLASCRASSTNDGAGAVTTGDEGLPLESDRQTQTSESGDATEKEDTAFEYLLLSNDTYGIKKLLDTTLTELVIPESYNGKAVTKIMSGAFKAASKL